MQRRIISITAIGYREYANKRWNFDEENMKNFQNSFESSSFYLNFYYRNGY